jgi:hypothetical protein
MRKSTTKSAQTKVCEATTPACNDDELLQLVRIIPRYCWPKRLLAADAVVHDETGARLTLLERVSDRRVITIAHGSPGWPSIAATRAALAEAAM